jgi:hypothetical protein
MTPEQLARSMAFLSDICRLAGPHCDQFVTPICGDSPERPHQLGTGTLFRVGERSFLVTARHVVDQGGRLGLPLMIFNDGPTLRRIQLEGRLLRSQPSPFDLALFELTGEIVSGLSNKRFLRLADIELRSTVGPGYFWVHGFPEVMTHWDSDASRFTLQRFMLGAPRLEESNPPFEDFDPACHFLLSAQAGELFTSDGRPAALPQRLHGISGCSLWRLYEAAQPVVTWSLDCVKAVAVQTGLHRGGAVIRGTTWRGVLQMLWDTYPNLRDSIEMNLFAPGRHPDERL